MPQPWPDRQDEQLREVFLKELKQLLNQPDVDIWFADESGFEGDPRPRKRWDKKGRKTRVTKWHGWQPKYLPPYSPDLNPIERIWLTMKARWFNNHVCKNEEQLLERLDKAILDVIYNPLKTQKTAAIGTLL